MSPTPAEPVNEKFKVGDRVRSNGWFGGTFTGTVIEIRGPFSVVIRDDKENPKNRYVCANDILAFEGEDDFLN